MPIASDCCLSLEMGLSKRTSDSGDKATNPWSVRGLVSRLKSKKNSDLGDLMVIGIDFGTT